MRIHDIVFKKLLQTSAVLVCGTLTIFSSAETTSSLCEGLKTIKAGTTTQYRELRGPFDSAMDQYTGTLLPNPMTECFTHSDGGAARYKCQQRLPDDQSQARYAFDSLVAGVKQCFGDDVQARKSTTPNRVEFRNTVGGETISIRFRRHVPKYPEMPPRYMIHLDVSTVELNEKTP